ncbi:hypothetical protein DH2020_042469 [Rehmannia glutinosa]|uniref:Uncharacterized protein n=1 Tax=Rehmannia glutinosa TaxID=99300 RepID=A0ABR0UMA9_REHGL
MLCGGGKEGRNEKKSKRKEVESERETNPLKMTKRKEKTELDIMSVKPREKAMSVDPEMMHYEAELGRGSCARADLLLRIGCGASIVITNPKGEDPEVREERMRKFVQIVGELAKQFTLFKLEQIPREENVKADHLSKIASSAADCGTRMITVLSDNTCILGQDVLILNEGVGWRNDIRNYLTKSILPEEKIKASRIQARALGYCLIGGVLYKRAFSQPFLRCLSREEGAYVLQELHEGACGSHGQKNQDLVGRDEGYATFHICSTSQANGQVEVTNRTLVRGLKASLERAGGGWVDELQSVLWSHWTSPKEATRETPFSLVYGTEAVIPVEIGMETHRVQNYEETYNNELMREALDELEEKIERAHLRMEVNRTLMKSAYDKQVRKQNFQVGDLVLRQADALKKRDKLESNWEGPYRVVKVIRGGAYELEDLEGHKVLRPWNVCYLKKFPV